MIFFVQDQFVEHYTGGAELTTEAIMEKSLFPCNKIIASQLNPDIMKRHKNDFWIFGNFTDLSSDCILYAAKNLNYSIIEYDYKYCFYRSPGKHILSQGECNCHQTNRGKLISIFFHSEKALWWMSQRQMEVYYELYPFLKNKRSRVLSSVFSDETLKFISDLDTSKKNNKWLNQAIP